jgi:hypothetical protein
MDARHLADVITKGTPFRLPTVSRWLQLAGVDTSTCTALDRLPAQWLYCFLVEGIQASPADIHAYVAHLYQLEEPQLHADPMLVAGGFMDMRRVHAQGRRLVFGLPFSYEAYANPYSPFYSIGHPNKHKEGDGWYPCGCWKCH